MSMNPLPEWATEAVILRVLAALQTRRQYDPLSSRDIAEKVLALDGVTDGPGQPGTRAVITEIVRRGLAPVGATAKGYFIIETKEELERYEHALTAREMGIAARRMNVRRAWLVQNGQAADPWVPEPEEEA